MNEKFLPAIFFAILFCSCQTNPFWTNDATPDDGAQWDSIEFQMKPYIQGLLATPYELYAISENSFVRLSTNLDIIERRPFLVPSKSNSLPALSENTLARLTTNGQGRQVVEFHLARNSTELHNVLVDTLEAPAGNTLEIESFGNQVGVFSNDGTLFLMAAKVLPSRYYSLYLFDIRQNVQHNSFVSVKVIKRMDLPDLSANADGVIKSMRFLGGNFYIASQQGAWRITPTGVASKIFPQWKEDCFSWEGTLYMTGTYDYDLEKSTDNGQQWERVNIGTELRHVVVADTTIFTQRVAGTVFSVMPKDLKKAKPINYPSVAKPATSFFYGIVFFEDRYFFSMDEWIFATDKVMID